MLQPEQYVSFGRFSSRDFAPSSITTMAVPLCFHQQTIEIVDELYIELVDNHLLFAFDFVELGLILFL